MMRRLGMPQACFKDDVSSGPSNNDVSFSDPLKTLFQGPSSPAGDPTSISQGYANQASSPAVPSGPGTFSFSSPFSAESSASSGAGTSQSSGDPFASVAQPSGVPTGTTGVFQTGATPFQTFGAPGAATSTDLAGASGGGPVAPSAPTGVSPIAGPDPTTAISSSGAGQPGAAPGAGQGGSFLDNLFSSVGKSFTNNPLSFLGGAGMLYNAYQQNQAMKGIPSISQIAPQLEQQASQLNQQGQQLAQYLTSGNLPPGLQASLDQATKAAKQNIISNFASRGLPTDPTKNSALAQELAMVDAQAVISTAQMGQQLMQTGIQETGLSSQLYTTLANIDQSMQANIQKSIAGFAAAMSPTKSISLNTAA